MIKIGRKNFTIIMKKEMKKFYLYKKINLIKVIKMWPYQEILEIIYIKSLILMTQIIFVLINCQNIKTKIQQVKNIQDKKLKKIMKWRVLKKTKNFKRVKQKNMRLISKLKNKRLKMKLKNKKQKIYNKNNQHNSWKTNYKNNQMKRKDNKKKKMKKKKKIIPKLMGNLVQTKKLMSKDKIQQIFLNKISTKK